MSARVSTINPAPRRRRPLWLRAIGWFLLLMLVLALLAFGGGYVYFRQSLPQIDGSARIPGLRAPVEVIRDSDGVPHIYAQNDLDALFAIGYVHAQDRLWQMELQRRIGRATLSEVLGEPALSTDRFLRTLGVYRAATSAYQALDADTKGKLEAYVAGINAFLSAHSGSDFPPEWTLLGVEPEPWKPEDVLAWAKMMAWDLGGNWSTELLRADLVAQVGPERAAQLLPDYPEAGATILQANAGGTAPVGELLALADQVRDDLGGMGTGILGGAGSNNWVVGGARTVSGKPLLADDPHLAFKTPSIWYLAEIKGDRMHSIGATIPGLPGVIIGHNGKIAWGVTNLGPDVQDLYREKLDASGTMAEFDGKLEPLTIITETLRVKDKGDVALRVRISRHGPLITDALNANSADPALDEDERSPQREAMAFRWTALDPTDTTIKAYFDLNLAGNWDEFRAALRPYVAPSQNFVFADTAGNIGYYAPGNIPIRAGGEGLLPAEGWNAASEWTGFIPFEELPHAYNPPEGYVVTANNRAVPDGYPHFLGREWAAPYRAERITELITATEKLSLDDMGRIQADQHSLYAERLLPILLKHTQPADDRQRQALDLLAKWDYNVRGDSPAAAIFEVWAYYLPAPILADDLDARLLKSYASRRSSLDLFLPDALQNPASPWCDNAKTPAAEDCASRLQEALGVALADIETRAGTADMAAWRWDALHLALFAHNPLDRIPALQSTFSNVIGNGGDGNTVNVAPVAVDQPFDQTHGPMYRHVIDLGDLGASRFINTPGQAGHPFSDHYDDLIERWQRVEYLPMRFDRASVEAAAEGTLRLEPQP